MKSGKTFFCIVLTAFYLLFPGNGLAFVNHILHDRGLQEIDCPCCSENERQAGHPMNGDDENSCVQNIGCACISHIPINNYPLESDQNIAGFPLCEPLFFLSEMYYPIFIPPKILGA
ncbi:MAG: hypothetical protein EG828_04155 [Deltaproteobacteria bacterium]|nr:hypothetical protein [Deltaproteobacteria bacterium]